MHYIFYSLKNPTESFCFFFSQNLDDLFGQCWDGEGSLRKAFTLDNGIDGLTDNKLIALEYTIDFLNHYHLDWKDYMTQCILSHILIDHYQLNRDRLISFYSDCLEKDELLDELATNNINRRQINQDYSKFFDF